MPDTGPSSGDEVPSSDELVDWVEEEEKGESDGTDWLSFPPVEPVRYLWLISMGSFAGTYIGTTVPVTSGISEASLTLAGVLFMVIAMGSAMLFWKRWPLSE